MINRFWNKARRASILTIVFLLLGLISNPKFLVLVTFIFFAGPVISNLEILKNSFVRKIKKDNWRKGALLLACILLAFDIEGGGLGFLIFALGPIVWVSLTDKKIFDKDKVKEKIFDEVSSPEQINEVKESSIKAKSIEDEKSSIDVNSNENRDDLDDSEISQKLIDSEVESTKPINKTYSYELAIWGHGGEHHIGVLENDMAKYWLNEGKEFFEDYLKASSSWREPLIDEHKIPEEYQDLPDWYDFDDFSVHGPEIFEDETIITVNEVITELETGKTLDSESEVTVSHKMIQKEDDSDFVIEDGKPLWSKEPEKGNFTYEIIESSEPLDFSELKLVCKEWMNSVILSHFEYKGSTYYLSEGGELNDVEIFFDN